MQNHPGVDESSCVVRKVRANNHGDFSTGLDCRKKSSKLFDFHCFNSCPRTCRICKLQSFRQCCSIFCLRTALKCCKCSAGEKINSLLFWNAIFPTTSQQNIFQIALQSKLMRKQSFHKCLVGNLRDAHVHLKWGANTWNQTVFETVFCERGSSWYNGYTNEQDQSAWQSHTWPGPTGNCTELKYNPSGPALHPWKVS